MNESNLNSVAVQRDMRSRGKSICSIGMLISLRSSFSETHYCEMSLKSIFLYTNNLISEQTLSLLQSFLGKPMNEINQTINDQKKCGCRELQYAPEGWIEPPCPFRMGDVRKYRRQEKDIVVSVFCACGREVGQLCFSGRENVGKWRISKTLPPKEALKNIQNWLSLIYIKEFEEIGELTVEMEKTMKRISNGLGDL